MNKILDCPKCDGNVTRKIGSGAGLLFKGSGFYITDYKNKSTKGKDSTKTDNKSASTEKKVKKDDNKKE